MRCANKNEKAALVRPSLDPSKCKDALPDLYADHLMVSSIPLVVSPCLSFHVSKSTSAIMQSLLDVEKQIGNGNQRRRRPVDTWGK